MKPISSCHRIPVLASLLLAAALPLHAAGPDPAAAKKLAEQHVAARDRASGDPQASHEATQVEVADLEGDGQDEIIVLWTMLGPTYWSHGVTVLAGKGDRYLPAGETQDPLGSVEGMQVMKGVIQLTTKWPGPNDPRCCPTLQKTLRYRWASDRLMPVK
ncbi:hypothetical protein OVA13_04820 [Pseudoxanthomonas sp. SL93]|uniref:hypothetical protein n=1 Tax=Pseudoxanthomonas sp. SL93 TaxID=2995142 RepID=UPI00226E3F54|nr:hypothetical protein [Pseudoxanthomonas sp. SL93]WAC64106.1 hypothetical protein OVA13_04820 [Pseudoxanthomonas sp. SL93]